MTDECAYCTNNAELRMDGIEDTEGVICYMLVCKECYNKYFKFDEKKQEFAGEEKGFMVCVVSTIDGTFVAGEKGWPY